MTTALRSDEATALSASVDVQQVSARMSVFLAEELLPLMAGLWPASANQLDSNARGVALAWGSMLKEFNAQQIREALLQLGEDAERQFAPKPAEVRAMIVKAAPVATVAQGSPCISIRACEVIAEARVFQRERAVPADEWLGRWSWCWPRRLARA
ncbi:hypothetical protein [Aeromonas hydrophila]|uniref:hypothetical protein n=1 Tax=Aeromonas hydrophila TaxID=644 RepID=UPI0023660EA5|nr:hypothetical protein [Aeromonas hydrophila]WDF91725.1 hypothetical protein PUB83_05500 [Aeromonas hydrophila subsp. hydrophila]